jgi:hypothetical protein
VEELNEFDELHEAIGDVATTSTSITTTPAKVAPVSEGGTSSKPVAPASATPSAPSNAPQPKKENVPQHTSTMAQLAQEAAAKAKETAKKIPTPLASKKNAVSSSTTETEARKAKETPLSPSGVPLPMSPAVKSPTSSGSIKSPTGSISHHRHSSTSSAHSYIPEKSESEPTEHRGSELSATSEEEIRRIESECAIAEEDEPDEEAVEDEDEDEDKILFGDGEDEGEDEKAAKKTSTSVSGPSLTPVQEEKASDKGDKSSSRVAPNALNIRGGPKKIEAIMKSAGITPAKVDNKEAEPDSAGGEDEDEKGTKGPETTSSKSAPAAAFTDSTNADKNLSDVVAKVKIQD